MNESMSIITYVKVRTMRVYLHRHQLTRAATC
jgi:hypothetical protein